jgi:sulfate adenylyltransferase subunit 1
VQYTRNMVTGASTANLALVLVDARSGVLEQTRRHALVASLLRIPHLVLCVNKMDLVGWSQERFEEIVDAFSSFASRLEIPDIKFLPVCALHGDNVVLASPRLPWHRGGSLLYTLETAYIGSDHNHVDARFPVQTVIRPNAGPHRDYRGLAGRVAAGVFKPGDPVVVLPGGRGTRIRSITALGRPVGEAFAPMSVEMTLDDDVDAGRGDMLAKPHNQPAASHAVEAMVCWFSPQALVPGGRYRIRHTTREALAVVREVRYKVDVGTLHRKEGDRQIGMNDIGRVLLRASVPLLCDPYKRNRSTGSFILMDEFTNATVAAGMVI